MPNSKDNRFTLRCTRMCGLFALLFSGFAHTVAAASAQADAVDKTGDIRLLYGAVFALAVAVLAVYLRYSKKLGGWFLVLGASVCIANGGYLLLSLAPTLSFAMFANAVTYLGAALLPLSMLMIIIDACRLPFGRRGRALLCGISLCAFLLAAGGSKFGLYYEKVTLVQVHGASAIEKVYGPLHILYTVYLVAYFALMLAVILYAHNRGYIEELRYTMFLVGVVFSNLMVWFIGQLIPMDFEFLSVTYIIAELLMLLVHGMIYEYDNKIRVLQNALRKTGEGRVVPDEVEALLDSFRTRAQSLTAAERNILRYYMQGHEVAEVAQLAFISVNTVRRHNANIYAKLEVASKEELLLYLDLFRCFGQLQEILPDPDTSAR